MLQAIPYHLGAYFARFLPDWLCRAITWTLAEVNYILRPRTRRVLVENLAIIHGTGNSRELRAKSRRVIHHFARSILLFLQLPFLDREELDERCDFSALKVEVERLGKGRAFIVASAHLGPWEMGGYGLSRLGRVVHTVALDHPSPRVTKFYSDRRAYLGMHAYPVAGSVPRLTAALDRGECVALLIDRSYGKAKKRFTLFGVETEFPLGHLVLSLRCRVPVLTGAIVFDGPRRIRYVHGGTHEPVGAHDDAEALEKLEEKCLRDLERIIRAHSDQWFNFAPLGRTEAHGG